jgi:hypothetical protein
MIVELPDIELTDEDLGTVSAGRPDPLKNLGDINGESTSGNYNGWLGIFRLR